MDCPVVAWGIWLHLSRSASMSLLMSYGLLGCLQTHLPRMSHKCWIWRQVWGLCCLWESCYSAKLQVVLDNTRMMGSFIVILTDECIPMLTSVGHNSRLNDIVTVVELVTVVEPSDIPLADMEFCLSSHGDPCPNHDTSTSIADVWDHGWRLVMLLSLMPNPLPPTMKIGNKFRLIWQHDVGPLWDRLPLTFVSSGWSWHW